MTVEQALESSFFNGTKLDKTDISMEITENESSSKKKNSNRIRQSCTQKNVQTRVFSTKKLNHSSNF